MNDHATPRNGLGPFFQSHLRRFLTRLSLWRERARKFLWWRVAERTIEEISQDNVPFLAAGVAFNLFLSFPALLSGMISLYGLGFDAGDVERQIQGLEGIIPSQILPILYEQCQRITSAPPQTLGLQLAISFIVALWSGRAGILALITAMNRAHGDRETRNFLELQAVALGLGLYIIVFGMLAIGFVVVLPIVLAVIPLGPFEKVTAGLFQWCALVVLELTLLGAIYRFGPSNRTRGNRSWPGAIIAALLWLGASALFSIYASVSATYNRVYGSVGGVVILLTWLYLTIFVVLLGAEVNAALRAERRAAAIEKPRGSMNAARL